MYRVSNDGSFYDDLDVTRAMKIPTEDKKINNERNRSNKSNKPKKNNKKKAIIIVSTILTILLIVGAGAGLYVWKFLGGLKSDEIPKAVEPEENGIVNILLIGKDIGTVGDEGDQSAKRTDTIMLVNMNLETKAVNVVSIPRDTKVTDNTSGEDVKINSLYHYGVDVLKTEVEELLMVSVNYIVEVDYNAFRSFIDAIGGVEVTPECDMYYDDPMQDLHINFVGGEPVLLDGYGAEEYFRWRQNNDGTGLPDGDIGRIRRQQEFMNEIFKKCISPEIVTKIPTIVDVMKQNITTNMNAKAIMKYAMEVPNMSSDKIVMNTLPGGFEEIRDPITDELLVSFWAADPEQSFELICKLNPDKDVAELQKASQKVIVLNGTGISGLAGDVKEKLEKEGYHNVDAGNADEIYDFGMVQAWEQGTADAICKSTGVNDQLLEVWPAYSNYDAVIIIGMDYTEKQTASN